eukprot:symbB.v1.2.034434.t1/scaffold4444.1/size39528/1
MVTFWNRRRPKRGLLPPQYPSWIGRRATWISCCVTLCAPAVRFWQASQTLRLRRLKARVAPEVASSISFEFPKGLVVGQTSEACVLANGLWRLPIYRPRNSSGTADKGWVTLSAELSGGPRFLRPIDWKSLNDESRVDGTPSCGESALQVHLDDFWQQSAATVAAQNDAATLGVETLQVPEGILHLNEDMLGVGDQLPAGLSDLNVYRIRRMPDERLMDQLKRDALHAADGGTYGG